MFPLYPWRWFALPVVCALALAACGGSATPQLIGSYPKDTGSSPTYAPPPENLMVVYNAYLELEVYDTDSAARKATQLVYDYGGYLVSSQTWYQNDRKYTTLTLSVPVAQFDATRQALLGLGKLITENVSGDRVSTRYSADGWNTFSNITIQLRPSSASIKLPSLPSFGWNPARTFERAFSIFASIFTFLVDIVIWAAVVVGPFVLMGLGARALMRRLRHP